MVATSWRKASEMYGLCFLLCSASSFAGDRSCELSRGSIAPVAQVHIIYLKDQDQTAATYEYRVESLLVKKCNTARKKKEEPQRLADGFWLVIIPNQFDSGTIHGDGTMG